MDSPKQVLDSAIQTMQRKAATVKALVKQVLQPVGYWSPEGVMKLKSDVVGEMDHLVHDSLQFQCSLHNFRSEQELKGVLDWAIQAIQRKANRVKALVEQVLQSGRPLWPAAIMKLKTDVVEEMDDLDQDSLQCQCSLDKFLREQEPDSGSPPSGVTIPSPSESATPRNIQEHFEEDWGVEYDSDQLPSFSD